MKNICNEVFGPLPSKKNFKSDRLRKLNTAQNKEFCLQRPEKIIIRLQRPENIIIRLQRPENVIIRLQRPENVIIRLQRPRNIIIRLHRGWKMFLLGYTEAGKYYY